MALTIHCETGYKRYGRGLYDDTTKDTEGDYMTGSGVSVTSLTKSISFVDKIYSELKCTFDNTI